MSLSPWSLISLFRALPVFTDTTSTGIVISDVSCSSASRKTPSAVSESTTSSRYGTPESTDHQPISHPYNPIPEFGSKLRLSDSSLLDDPFTVRSQSPQAEQDHDSSSGFNPSLIMRIHIDDPSFFTSNLPCPEGCQGDCKAASASRPPTKPERPSTSKSNSRNSSQSPRPSPEMTEHVEAPANKVSNAKYGELPDRTSQSSSAPGTPSTLQKRSKRILTPPRKSQGPKPMDISSCTPITGRQFCKADYIKTHPEAGEPEFKIYYSQLDAATKTKYDNFCEEKKEELWTEILSKPPPMI